MHKNAKTSTFRYWMKHFWHTWKFFEFPVSWETFLGFRETGKPFMTEDPEKWLEKYKAEMHKRGKLG